MGMSKPAKQPKATKRPDLGARWSHKERAEIDAAAARKGVKPTQIIRMAVRKFLDDEAKAQNG